jgi:SAM-dependent methyltransferase
MIERARRYNRAGARCSYHLNERDDIALFRDSTFDLVLSEIVLQHMQPSYALAYVREFVRILKPAGLAVFQVPYESVGPAPAPAPWDRDAGPRIDMFAVPFAEVVSTIEQVGAEMVRYEETEISGPAWRSYRYAVTKPPRA